MRRNKSHLAIAPSDTRRWILTVPATATSVPAQRAEAIEVHRTLYESLESVFRPITAEIVAHRFSGKHDDVRATTFTCVNPLESVREQIVASGQTPGLNLKEQWLDSGRRDQWRVGKIETTGKTGIRLDNGDHWLDNSDTDRVRKYKNDREAGTTTTDPLKTTISSESIRSLEIRTRGYQTVLLSPAMRKFDL
jgi:hypothetical protein